MHCSVVYESIQLFARCQVIRLCLSATVIMDGWMSRSITHAWIALLTTSGHAWMLVIITSSHTWMHVITTSSHAWMPVNTTSCHAYMPAVITSGHAWMTY